LNLGSRSSGAEIKCEGPQPLRTPQRMDAQIPLAKTSFSRLHTEHGQLAKATRRSGKQMKPIFRYHHLGIPVRKKVSGMVEVRRLKIHVTDHEANPFGIQWMFYGKDCKVSNLVRNVPHAAFEVDDLKTALKGRKVIIEPNSPSPGVLVAFIEEAGAPIELLQFTKTRANTRHRANEKRKTQK
jgi:hypothetical protein